MFDPTPMQIADEIASRVVAWVGTVDDLSGHASLDDQWNSFAQLGDSLKDIFREVGKVYVPALLANSEAVESGAETVRTEIDGIEWVQ